MREFLVEITTSVPDGTPAGRRRGAPRERILGTLPLPPWTQRQRHSTGVPSERPRPQLTAGDLEPS
ncbi:hypothetical protein [Streptomyces sp. NPDC004658]|uniref:hypothetical protein n=1 Tax=Streptomyces sp. NPDC004658 TaxID=3154672 RepID=UPI0033B9753C